MEFMKCSQCDRQLKPTEVARYGTAAFRKCDECRTVGRNVSMFRLDNTIRHAIFDERIRRKKKSEERRAFLQQNVPTHPHDHMTRAFLQDGESRDSWVAQAILYGWGENMPPITSIQNGDVKYRAGNNREVTQRISRYARRFIHPKLQEFITDRDVELFYVDMRAKSHVPTYTYETVRGEDIRFWYHQQNYGNGDIGTLRHSCMQYAECQPYMNIYTENPDQCQMIIVRDEETNKIYGRTIVWLATDGVWYMERAYGSELVCRLIYSFGEEQGFQRLTNNVAGLRVQLSNWLFRQYPHVDTMSYLNARTGQIMYSYRNADIDNNESYIIQMHGVGGELYTYGNEWARCNDCRSMTVMPKPNDEGTVCVKCGTVEERAEVHALVLR